MLHPFLSFFIITEKFKFKTWWYIWWGNGFVRQKPVWFMVTDWWLRWWWWVSFVTLVLFTDSIPPHFPLALVAWRNKKVIKVKVHFCYYFNKKARQMMAIFTSIWRWTGNRLKIISRNHTTSISISISLFSIKQNVHIICA